MSILAPSTTEPPEQGREASPDRRRDAVPAAGPAISAPGRLESWGEIATFLRRGVRTVQRWERHEGLPIHRHQHRSRGTVYASRTEVAEWLEARRGGLFRIGHLVEHAHDAIIGLTPEGTVAVWNSGAERLLGYTARGARGESLVSFVAPDQRETYRDLVHSILGGGAARRLDIALRTRSNRRVAVSMVLSPIKSADDRIVGVSAIAREGRP